MKRVLITGGAGFIGSNLCKRLLEEDYHVTCLDNYYTGKRKNIEKFFGKERENAAMVRNAVATFEILNIAPALTFDGSEDSRSSRSSRSSSESRVIISHFSSLLNNIGVGRNY